MFGAGISSIPGSHTQGVGIETQMGQSGGAIPSFLNDQNQNADGSKPRAFLNWILLDEHFQYVASSSGSEQVGDDEEFTIHQFNDLPISKNGYLFIYVSNESTTIPVYFDNLQVTHTKGRILEETHYYPFGLVMKGISTKSRSFTKPILLQKLQAWEERKALIQIIGHLRNTIENMEVGGKELTALLKYQFGHSKN